MEAISEAMRRCLTYLKNNEPGGIHLWPIGSVGVTMRMANKAVVLGYAHTHNPTVRMMTVWRITPEGLAALEQSK